MNMAELDVCKTQAIGLKVFTFSFDNYSRSPERRGVQQPLSAVESCSMFWERRGAHFEYSFTVKLCGIYCVLLFEFDNAA